MSAALATEILLIEKSWLHDNKTCIESLKIPEFFSVFFADLFMKIDQSESKMVLLDTEIARLKELYDSQHVDERIQFHIGIVYSFLYNSYLQIGKKTDAKARAALYYQNEFLGNYCFYHAKNIDKAIMHSQQTWKKLPEALA